MKTQAKQRTPGRTTSTQAKTSQAGSPRNNGREGSRLRSQAEEAQVHYVDNDCFHLADAEAQLWGEDQHPLDIPGYRLLPDIEEPSAGLSETRRLTSKEEKHVFLRYNYAKFRWNELLLVSRRPSRRRDQQIDLWRQRAEDVRERIINANLPLAPAMAKRKVVVGAEFADMVSEAYMAILRCIEHFDVSRGFKFSTYACRSILACFQRLGSKAQTYRKHVPVHFEPSMETSDDNERRLDGQKANACDSVRQVLRRNAANLTDIERQIMKMRFPMSTRQKRLPLWKVGKSVGLSNERVRQIERRSLAKLRDAVEMEMAV